MADEDFTELASMKQILMELVCARSEQELLQFLLDFPPFMNTSTQFKLFIYTSAHCKFMISLPNQKTFRFNYFKLTTLF